MEMFLNGDILIEHGLEQNFRTACHKDIYITDVRDTYTKLDLSPQLRGGRDR